MLEFIKQAGNGIDMNTITYADIDEAFPFAVQMEVMKKIIEVISPGYEETRKN